MPKPVSVAEYLDALTRELRFDVQLSQRVRHEVEDHLLDAIGDDASGDPSEAQRQAIARFGDPHEIARQYAPLSLLQQVRRVGAIIVVAIAAILVLMKGRGALYQFLQWRLNADWLGGLGTIGSTIDRYAFQVALGLGILGWLYIASRRPAPRLNSSYQLQLKRGLLLSGAAAALLIGSVILDTILAGVRSVGAGVSPAGMIPLLSIAIEVALVGVIAVELRKAIQRKTLVSSLFADEKNTTSLAPTPSSHDE
jgi:hypothetical protein